MLVFDLRRHVVLELFVEIAPVRDDDDRAVERLVVRVVQAGELMGGPRNRVGFARVCAVLDEIVFPDAVFEGRFEQFAGRPELMVAGEDERLLFLDLARIWIFILFDLKVDKAMDDVEPAVPFPDLLPQIAGFVAGDKLMIGRIPPAAVVADVKGQKVGPSSGQFGRHRRFVRINGKVDQRTFFELDERSYVWLGPDLLNTV